MPGATLWRRCIRENDYKTRREKRKENYEQTKIDNWGLSLLIASDIVIYLSQ